MTLRRHEKIQGWGEELQQGSSGYPPGGLSAQIHATTSSMQHERLLKV